MTDVAVDTVVAEPKTRKPRSPNKPRTPEKAAYYASKKIDKLNEKEDEAVKRAIARVRASFKLKVEEVINELPEEAVQFVTGIRHYDDDVDAENPDVTDLN